MFYVIIPKPAHFNLTFIIFFYHINDREMIGTISCEMIQHCLESFALSCRLTLHVHNIHGTNNHHKAESAFKALGVALREAVERDSSAGIPSTKGVLA